MKQEEQNRLDSASQFFIMTPMAKLLHDTLKQWTWCGMTGGVIVGEARNGKSMAIKSLKDIMTSRTGENIPVFRISIGDRDLKTIRSVFKRVAHALGQTVKNSYSADDLAMPIKMHLADAAMMNSTRQVIMIIDEAQLLTIQQISVFAEIYNDLFEIDHNCTIYFIANENQFGKLAKKLIKDENKYLRERFFSHVHHFYGLRSAADVKHCLRQYDQYVLDDHDNHTATEYYCPNLYKTGWRYSKMAKPLWQLYYENYMIPLNHTSWSMSQFVRTANILLMDYLPDYEEQLNQEIIEGLIIQSLDAAGIKPTIQQFADSC